jgi:hypothetical protein
LTASIGAILSTVIVKVSLAVPTESIALMVNTLSVFGIRLLTENDQVPSGFIITGDSEAFELAGESIVTDNVAPEDT